jgi:hypothetical protein
MYIAPPERHLLVESEQLRLGSGPRENNARLNTLMPALAWIKRWTIT